MSGILNVARLLIQLREGRVHALFLAAGLAVLLWDWLLRRGASLGLTVHRRRKHLSRENKTEMTSLKDTWGFQIWKPKAI